MNDNSASAALITTAPPDRPHVLPPALLPFVLAFVLAFLGYGLLQKVAAGRVVRAGTGHGARA